MYLICQLPIYHHSFMQIKIMFTVLILVVDLFLLGNLIFISSVLIILHLFIMCHILPSYSVIFAVRWTSTGPPSTMAGHRVTAGRRQGSIIRDTLCRRCQITMFVYNELYISLFIMFYVLVG